MARTPGDAPKRPDTGKQRGEERASEALVYIGGLDLGLSANKTVGGVIRRIQTACDRQALTRSASFSVKWYDREPDAPATTPVATIGREDKQKQRPAIDVFEYEWSKAFVDRWNKQGVLKRAARTAFTLAGFGSFFRFFRTGAKRSARGRAQLVIAVAMLALVALYAATVFIAAGFTVYQVVLRVGGETDIEVTVWQWIATVGTLGVGAAAKSREKLRGTAAALVAAEHYLRVADAQPEITGRLVELIERLGSTGQYRRIHIVAYSFGSIVAIDTMYPTSGPPEHSLDPIDTLVTIGSPIDFVRAVRPKWTEGRVPRPGVPSRWINIYAEVDLFGSDFQTGKTEPKPLVVAELVPNATVTPTKNVPYDLGIEPKFLNLLQLCGFVSHGLYWDAGEAPDRNVFRIAVTELYEGEPILA